MKSKELPQLCVAVKRVREALGESQEKFAQRTGIASMTVSRFERGKLVPREYRVVRALWEAAADAGLDHETRLFDSVLADTPAPSWPSTKYPLQEWRLMQAARIAVRFYRFHEQALAIEKAAAPALALVDQILKDADPVYDLGGSSPNFDLLEDRLNELVERGF